MCALRAELPRRRWPRTLPPPARPRIFLPRHPPKIMPPEISKAVKTADRRSARQLVANPPDSSVAVFRDKQGAVVRCGNADRTAPDVGVVDDKSGDEVLVFAGRHAIFHPDADHFIAGPLRPVPGAVLGRKAIAAIFGREVVAGVERHAERSRMRLTQDVGDRHLVLQIGPLALVPGIFVAADIEPRPAIKRIFADARHVVGHEVIAEAVALIGGAPGRADLRLDRQADAITDSGRKYFLILAIGVERQHRRAIGLVTPDRAHRMLAAPGLKPARRRAAPLAVIAR